MALTNSIVSQCVTVNSPSQFKDFAILGTTADLLYKDGMADLYEIISAGHPEEDGIIFGGVVFVTVFEENKDHG